MGATSLRARIARWIGGNLVQQAGSLTEDGSTPRVDAVDPESLPLVERVRALEAEMLDLSTQWSDLNDAVRKWSARLASQKAAETRKALAAMGNGGGDPQLALDGQPEAETADPESPAAQAERQKLKAELNRRWLARRGGR